MSSPDDRLTARRVAIVIGLVLATLLGLARLWAVRRVLVWILLAAFLAAGLLGALLAIPAAGILQILLRETNLPRRLLRRGT
ncbi:hypothetical protein ACQSSU_04840 [Micromonospora echinospora]